VSRLHAGFMNVPIAAGKCIVASDCNTKALETAESEKIEFPFSI
jgi:hypothetical protein